ncbi:hypothetical protein U9M48_020908 [Paspalum notatum var. saurae]|uniref:Uncharacterized protein n=1 Tax=Paspalum notatum var. saurae TaxID=547442 RepID=A0AAQ3WSX5_PASNO
MACRRLAREAVAASLRRGAAAAAPARAFSTAAAAAAAAATSCSSRAPVAASPIRQFLARYSSPAFQPRAAEFGLGQSLAARAALGLRPQLSGRNLLKGFGTSTVLGMALHQGKATAETKVVNWIGYSDYSPISLVLNVLLLVYCSRPSRYSIYLYFFRSYVIGNRIEFIGTKK